MDGEQRGRLRRAIASRWRPLRMVSVILGNESDVERYVTYAPPEVTLPLGAKWIGATIPVLSPFTGAIRYVTPIHPLAVEVEEVPPVGWLTDALSRSGGRVYEYTRGDWGLEHIPAIKVDGFSVPDFVAVERLLLPAWREVGR